MQVRQRAYGPPAWAGQANMSFLYRTEAKGIQSWILATNPLKELAGGSEVVNQLEELIRQGAEAAGGQLESAAAGTATIAFPHRAALEQFASWWPLVVSRHAPGLQVVQAWVEGRDWQVLSSRLREVRQHAVPDLPEAGPLLGRAGRTGLPAVESAIDGTRDRASRAKMRAFKRGRSALARKLLPRGGEFLQDNDAFGDGYLAVIHADANAVGLRLSGTDGKLDIKRFSEALRACSEEAARVAVESLPIHSGNNDVEVLARPIVLGGDDLTIIVPARNALTFTTVYLEAFEAQTRESADALHGPLHACAGIALVKKGWPFSSAYALSEELCGVAKQRCREESCSGLAFHRVSTSLATSWDEILEGELTSREAGPKHVLTRNPYTLDDIPHLRALERSLDALPRGAVRRWGMMVRDDWGRASELWQRMRGIARENQAPAIEAFDESLRGLGVDPETGLDAEARSPVLDAMQWHYARRRKNEDVGG